MINLRVAIKEVTQKLKRMLGRSQDMDPAMAAISMRMLSAVEENFRAEGRPMKWKALKTSTLAARATAGRSGKILQPTGHLARSITPFHSRTIAGVGTTVPYAAAMNNGSKPHLIKPKTKKALKFNGRFAKKVNHPGTAPRPFMVLTERDRGDILSIMAAHITSSG